MKMSKKPVNQHKEMAMEGCCAPVKKACGGTVHKKKKCGGSVVKKK